MTPLEGYLSRLEPRAPPAHTAGEVANIPHIPHNPHTSLPGRHLQMCPKIENASQIGRRGELSTEKRVIWTRGPSPEVSVFVRMGLAICGNRASCGTPRPHHGRHEHGSPVARTLH